MEVAFTLVLNLELTHFDLVSRIHKYSMFTTRIRFIFYIYKKPGTTLVSAFFPMFVLVWVLLSI